MSGQREIRAKSALRKEKKLSLEPQSNTTLKMKNKLLWVLIAFPMLFGSCSTKVELYADYKDVAVIYAMIDPQADTNFVKIIRAFCGTNDDPIDANEVALIPDSSNYPGKLDARIIELRNTAGDSYKPTGREFALDTMTLHNKELGVFYAPDQKIYYTTEHFNAEANGKKYKYRLVVVKPNGDTLTAQTSMVGGEDFAILSGGTNFQIAPTEAMGKMYFRADGAAVVYEIKMQFNYREQHSGQEVKLKNVSRSFGTKPLSSYPKVENTDDSYYQEYSVNWLFNALTNAIGDDTVVNSNNPNVVRYMDDFVVSISAAGQELYYYYLVNQAQSNSIAPLVSTYTNIHGGGGLFSSRTNIEKSLKLSASAKRDLFSVSAWGFKEE